MAGGANPARAYRLFANDIRRAADLGVGNRGWRGGGGGVKFSDTGGATWGTEFDAAVIHNTPWKQQVALKIAAYDA